MTCLPSTPITDFLAANNTFSLYKLSKNFLTSLSGTCSGIFLAGHHILQNDILTWDFLSLICGKLDILDGKIVERQGKPTLAYSLLNNGISTGELGLLKSIF